MSKELIHAAPLQLPGATPSLLLVWTHPQFGKEFVLVLWLTLGAVCSSVPEEQLHNIDEYDLNVVRLCFQAFLPDEHGNYTIALPPLISNPIYDNSEYQLGQMPFFSFSLLFFSLAWDEERRLPEVCASSGSLLWLAAVRCVSVTWQVTVSIHSNTIPGWNVGQPEWQLSMAFVDSTCRCFSSPCSHTAAMIARKGPCLMCQAIKVIVMRWMAASRLICFPRQSSGACLCP